METRELYTQKYEAQLEELGAKIAALEARAKRATAQAQLDLAPHVTAAQQKFKAAKLKFEGLGKTAEGKWDDVARDVESAWMDVKSAVSGAFDVLNKKK